MGLTLREIAERSLRDEVRTYDQYLRGEVYGWTAGESSCWGYFGSDVEKSGLLSDAKAAIDAEIGDRRRLHCRRLKTQIKHRVPLGVRTPQAV